MKFANEFARQMEDMLRGLATALDPSGPADGANASDPKPREQTDRLAGKTVERTASALSDSAEGKPIAAEELGDAFQTRLNAAMERLHSSDTSLQVGY
jgi:hypothetical protein